MKRNAKPKRKTNKARRGRKNGYPDCLDQMFPPHGNWFEEPVPAFDTSPEYWARVRANNARREKILLDLFDAVRKPGMTDRQLALAAIAEIRRRRAAGDPDWVIKDEQEPIGVPRGRVRYDRG